MIFGAIGPAHVCEVAWTSATSPDDRGRVEVTEWCDGCGEAICTFIDTIV